MNGDVIVMTFDGGETAQTVFASLQAMRKSHILGLDDTAIVTKDGVGQIKPHLGPRAGTGLARLLADLIFDIPGSAVPAVAWARLDGDFVGTVNSALRSNGSALLFFLHPDSLSDACELLKVLELFRGTIHQTTLSPQSEVLLRGLL